MFYVTIADTDIGSLKYLDILFDKYLGSMLVKFEQNRMVQITQTFELFDKTIVYLFWQSVYEILEVASKAETIVWC